MIKKHRLFCMGIIALGTFILNGCASQGGQNTINGHSTSESGTMIHDLDTFTVPVIRVGRYKLMTQDLNITAMSQLPITLSLSNDITQPSLGYVRLETAISAVIAKSGYSLCSNETVDQLITRAVPKEHYELGPMTRANMLQVLVGSEWLVNFNNLNGTVCFVPNTQLTTSSKSGAQL